MFASSAPVSRMVSASRSSHFWPSLLVLMAAAVPHMNAVTAGEADRGTALPRGDALRIVDISWETQRHMIVAQGTEKIYQGHADTLLMRDGKTMLCVWTLNHGWGTPFMKRSADAGLTWADVPIPKQWNTWNGNRGWLPMIHRLVDPQGKERLFIFDRGEEQKMTQSVTEDGGKTWSPMRANGLRGIEPAMNVLSFDKGRKLLMWYSDWRPSIYQAASYDGGLTWTEEREVIDTTDLPGVVMIEPGVVRSPDGKQLFMLIRDFADHDRIRNSLCALSNDEGRTWSKPRRTQPALTGERHCPLYAPDGRLVIAMRDTMPESPTKGQFVAWVGTYQDMVAGRTGQYRVKLLHNPYVDARGFGDCGYSSLHVTPDGTIIATTYIRYQPGKKSSVVSTRFKIEELDALLK